MDLKQTWQTFLKNKKTVPIPVISDLIFYYLLISLSVYTFNKLTAIAETLMDTFGDLADIVGTQTMQNARVIEQYQQVSKTMWLFIAGIILIWIIFKGINWYYAHLMSGNKLKIKEFALPFLIKSIFWYLLCWLGIMIAGYLNYKIFVGSAQFANPTTVFTLTMIAVWILIYFGVISYSIDDKKYIRNAFKTGIHKWKKTVPVYLLSTVVFIISLFIFYTLFIRNFYIALLSLLVIILPAIHFMRLLMINSIKRG